MNVSLDRVLQAAHGRIADGLVRRHPEFESCPRCDGDLEDEHPFECESEGCEFQAVPPARPIHAAYQRMFSIVYPNHRVIGALLVFFALGHSLIPLPGEVPSGFVWAALFSGIVLFASNVRSRCPACEWRIASGEGFCGNCGNQVGEPHHRLDPDRQSVFVRVRDGLKAIGPDWVTFDGLRFKFESGRGQAISERIVGGRERQWRRFFLLGTVVFAVASIVATVLVGRMVLEIVPGVLTWLDNGGSVSTRPIRSADVIWVIGISAVLAVVAVFHELAHAVACIVFGDEVDGVGFSMAWVVPLAAWVKTADDDVEPSRDIHIYSAGVWVNLLLGGAVLAAIYGLSINVPGLGPGGMAVRPIEWFIGMLALVNIVSAVNAVPLPGSDGFGYLYCCYRWLVGGGEPA